MAFIGMQFPVVAKVATEVSGSALTYSAGMVAGKAISGNLTWQRGDNPLYADDAIAEDDNGATGGSLEFGADDVSNEVRVYMLGLKEITVGTSPNTTTEYEQSAAASPYVGFGYIRVRRKNGVTTYQGVWYHKVQFGETNENANTKGQAIEWQTPTLTGRIFGVYNDASGVANFRRHAEFETMEAAKSWLRTKAGITTT